MDDSNGTMELPGASSPSARKVTINTDDNTLDSTGLWVLPDDEDNWKWAEGLKGLGERCLSALRLETFQSAIESRGYTMLMGVAATISIFGDQFRLAALPNSWDRPFVAINSVILVLCVLDIILVASVEDGYFLTKTCFSRKRNLHPALSGAPSAMRASNAGVRQSMRQGVGVVTQSIERTRQWLPSFFFFVDVASIVLMLLDPDFITTLPSPYRAVHANVDLGALQASHHLSHRAARLIRVLRATCLAHRFLVSRRKHNRPASAAAKARQQQQQRLANQSTTAVSPTTGSKTPTTPLNRHGSTDSSANVRLGGPTPLKAGAGKGPISAEGEGERPMGSNTGSSPQPESRIGAALSQASHRKVLVGGVLLLVVAPFLTYTPPDESWAFASGVLREAKGSGSAALSEHVAMLVQGALGGVLYLRTNGQVYVNDAALLSSRRACELARRYDVGSASLVIQDVKPTVQAEAWLGMLLTLVVCGLFVSLVMLIERDLADLVLMPLAKMTDLIDRISRRPLDPIDVNALRLDQRHGLEPTLLLQTISKIGALVKVGLGEAGADIITRNLRGSGSDFQINLNTSGKIVDGIFVFCDIRCFTDTTECLQEEVMVFVNKIAHILHDLVTQYGGSPNKNVGDAFLLVWKLADARGPESTVAADRALYCVLKFIYEMVLCQDYVCHFSSAASQRLFNRMPDYRVNIGFGLHVGWAVEGAIGSVQKIDASYISPHVSLSETLQDMTKEYGVTILFSDMFYNLLSSQARYHCRQVDAVGTDVDDREGGASCMGLYTYDCDVETLRELMRLDAAVGSVNLGSSMRLGSQASPTPRPRTSTSPTSPEAETITSARSSTNGGLGSTWRSLGSPRRTSGMPGPQANKQSSLLDQAASRALHGPSREPARPYDVMAWEQDEDLQLLRRSIAPGFRATWNFAMNSYLAGEWGSAKQGFETTLEMSLGKDGPSKFLLSEINKHDGRVPRDWKGFRVTSKH